ncbi:MAG: cytochrome c3 family protein [Anaerolineales bacterium]
MTFSVRKGLITVVAVVLLSLAIVACAGSSATPEASQAPAQTQACPDCPTCPEPTPCPEEGSTVEVPFEELWTSSPHNDTTAEAFNHWNEADPAEIPTSCAKCHSTPGMLDFLGADGTEANVVDNAAPIGSTIECQACHNDVTLTLDTVEFPSGAVITGLGGEARCMLCHQGRESGISVDEQIEDYDAVDAPDAVPEPVNDRAFGFLNIHYYAAAATLYGNEVNGGYQYPGKVYDAKYDHVAGYDTCIGCHNAHTLEIRVDECSACHEDVRDVEDLKDVRMVSSARDYDGDGDIEEGMYYEIEGVREILYSAIQAYAAEVTGGSITYDGAAYPYWFADNDGDSVPDQGENGAASFANWTPRLLKAAYNYQVSVKDPGNFAHGNKYTIQLMYDSIADLNEALSTPIDMSAMHRDDAGHFAGNTEPFRHWDAEGEVPGTCAKCHSATGLPTFLKEGVNVSAEPANGFQCVTCHNGEDFPELYEVASVTFPSGATVGFERDEDGNFVPVSSNICLECHQGRESKVSVDRAIGDKPLDTVDEGLRFLNIHYFAAGATLFGTEVQGIYEFDGREYLGQNLHRSGFNQCIQCHDEHALTINEKACYACHPTDNLADLRNPNDQIDYDGDGQVEGLIGEIETLSEAMFAQLQAYVATVPDAEAIAYDAAAYPYFFVDTNGNGTVDEGETDRYATFTPSSLIAAYNYQYVHKDPGAFAHNGRYVIQVLIDTIEFLGGDISAYTRP